MPSPLTRPSASPGWALWELSLIHIFFIPALESSGQISRLDWYVAEHVYKTILRSYRENFPMVPVSVNLSWMDFYDDSLMDDLMDIFQGDSLRRGDMRLEITETSYAALESDRAGILEQLRSAGVKILLDEMCIRDRR